MTTKTRIPSHARIVDDEPSILCHDCGSGDCGRALWVSDVFRAPGNKESCASCGWTWTTAFGWLAPLNMEVMRHAIAENAVGAAAAVPEPDHERDLLP